MLAPGLTLLLLSLHISDAPKSPPEVGVPNDFESALNERLGKGIRPEQNAVVLLWKAFGPTAGDSRGMPADYFRWLGITEPPNDGQYFIKLSHYLRDQAMLDSEAIIDFLGSKESDLSKRPWKAADVPHASAWLAANEKPLSVAVEATKRPHYFNPLVSRKTENDSGSLVGVGLGVMQMCRELAQALTCRAMLRVGEGKLEAARQDLLACHRLSRLVASGGTIMESLVGIAIEQIAATASLAYVERANLTAIQACGHIKDLQALQPFPQTVDKIDLYERYLLNDTSSMMEGRGGKWDQKKWDRKLTPQEQKIWGTLDWSVAVNDGNRWFDRIVAALRLKDRRDRQKALEKIEEERKSLKRPFPTAAKLLEEVSAKNPPDKAIVQIVGEIVFDRQVLPARKVQEWTESAEQIHRNLQLVFALTAYRSDEGRYPAKLASLSPKYLSEIPGDIFSGQGLIYKLEGSGYLLYSVGINGKDDLGRSTDDMPAADDIRVRMPLPELKQAK
jgi:hypothetical protein